MGSLFYRSRDRLSELTSSMSPPASNEKRSTRTDVRQRAVSRVNKAKAAQPKVAIRSSSRLKKKQIIQNRSAVFPGTKMVAYHGASSATVYLPDDVVINIFSIYLGLMQNDHKNQYQYPGFRASPFFLASVAFAWSRIVRNTPSLWKHLDLHLDPRRYKNQVKLLRQWLDHTSGCDLSISVLTHLDNSEYWERRLPRSIYDIVETRADQITDLSLPLFPDFHLRKMSGFENLQRLRLDCGQFYCPDPSDEAIFEIDAPALTQLQTHALEPGLIRIVDAEGDVAALDGLKSFSSHMICLHLTYGHFRDRQMQIDTQFSQLTHLDISGVENWPLEDDALFADAQRLRFPGLRYLRCNSFTHVTSQIGYAPLLTTLVCYMPNLGLPAPEFLEDAVDFLLGVDCTHLRTFIVSSPLQLFYADEEDIASLLWSQPDIQDISIIGAAYDERISLQYISHEFLRVFATPTSRLETLEETSPSTELVAPQLRSFTYCGPTDAKNFTSIGVFESLSTRVSLHSLRQVARCPLEAFRIMSTNKIVGYDDDDPAMHAAFAHLREHLPTLSVSLADETPIAQMYDADKLWPSISISPELKYISCCDRPREVDLSEPIDNKFFEMRYVMHTGEQTTHL